MAKTKDKRNTFLRLVATSLAVLCCSIIMNRPEHSAVVCAPLKLVSDLPSMALAALVYGNSPEEQNTIMPHHHHHHHHHAPSQAMSSFSSDSSEDDSEEDNLDAVNDAIMSAAALSNALKNQIASSTYTGRSNETNPEHSLDNNTNSTSLSSNQEQFLSPSLSNSTTKHPEQISANNTTLNDTYLSATTTTSAIPSNYTSPPTSSAVTSTTTPSITTTAVSRLYNLLVPPTVSRDSHLIRLPNGQSVQFCDETTGTCDDENAICKLGACVCKTGYFPNPNLRGQSQPGLCQSISDLLKNCDNDLQCKAFGVEFICDTKSHDRPSCDCAEGFYFDQETYTCLPCHRNTLVLTSMKFYSPQAGSSPLASNGSSESTVANQTSLALPGGTINSTSAGTTAPPKSSADTTTANTVVQHQQQLRPCKPYDRLGSRRRLPKPYFSSGATTLAGTGINAPNGIGQVNPEYTSIELTPRQFSNSGGINSSTSDPLRIRIPLEVFMGAVMLFTAFTVAWLFLQRMIHDCRAIMRSLRGADVISRTMNVDPNFGPMTGLGRPTYRTSAANAHFLDPAVAQLLTGEMSDGACNGNLAASLAASNANYQREIGVMVQHLTANLSPSSTSHALSSANSSNSAARNITPHLLSTYNEHEATLYPFATGGQQSRTATQLLLAPNHPALAILRAAASVAQHNSTIGDCGTAANVLSSMLDPPPKYEEAMAQTQQQSGQQTNIHQPPYLPPPASSGSSPESDVDTLRLEQADDESDRLNETGGNDFNESSGTGRNDEAMSRNQNQDLSSMLNVYISPNASQPESDDLLAINPTSLTNSSGNNTDSSAGAEAKSHTNNAAADYSDNASVASSQPANLGSRTSAEPNTINQINQQSTRRSSNDSELMRTNPRMRRLSDTNRSRRRRLTRRSRRRGSTTNSNNNQEQAQQQGQHNRSSDEVYRTEDDG